MSREEGQATGAELVRALAEILRGADLGRLEYRRGEELVVLEARTAPAAAVSNQASAAVELSVLQPAPAPEAPAGILVKTPLVGTVYRAREPGGPPLVQVGQRVRRGEVLCLIEAMKMFSEITAPAQGTVREILFQDGELAEYDAVLMTLDPGEDTP